MKEDEIIERKPDARLTGIHSFDIVGAQAASDSSRGHQSKCRSRLVEFSIGSAKAFFGASGVLALTACLILRPRAIAAAAGCPDHSFLVVIDSYIPGVSKSPSYVYNKQFSEGPSQISIEKNLSIPGGLSASVTAKTSLSPTGYTAFAAATASASDAVKGSIAGNVQLSYGFSVLQATKCTISLTAAGRPWVGAEASFVGLATPIDVRSGSTSWSGELPPGRYSLTCDAHGHPGEPASASFDLRFDEPHTDLTISSIQRVPSTQNPQDYSVALIASNSGLPNDQPATVKAYWASGPGLTDRLSGEARAFLAEIPAGLCGSTSFQIPEETFRTKPTEAAYLIAIVDEENQMPESQENNNTASIELPGFLLAGHWFYSVNPSDTDANAADSVAKPLVPTTNIDKLLHQRLVTSGLVADGVTPLLAIVHFTKFGLSARRYSLSAKVDGVIGGGDDLIQFSTLDDSGWRDTTELIQKEGHIDSFYYIKPIKSDDLKLPQGRASATVTITIAPVDPGAGPPATIEFRVHKPPLILIHGFNSSAKAWAQTFTDPVVADRGNLWKAIDYGVFGGDSSVNTFGSFSQLAELLDQVLKNEVERDSLGWRGEWAYTCYDVIGHSQGGVLTRMLCSERPNGGIPAFRSQANAFRGRFHRVVTIGSPHNGSTLVRYLFSQLFNEERSVEFAAGALKDVALSELAGLGGLTAASKVGAILPHIIPGALIDAGILQPKFDPFGSQIIELNKPDGKWTPDSAAQFHLIRTAVGGGKAPLITDPVSVALLWEVINLVLPGRGDVVLPGGSDGVVDFESQGAVNRGEASANNVSTLDPLANSIAHSGPAELITLNATATQTASSDVARQALAALNGDPRFPLGPFPDLRPLDLSVKTKIDDLGFGSLVVDENIKSLNPKPLKYHAIQRFDVSRPPENLSFEIAPTPGEPIANGPNWFVQGFGTNGTFVEGLAAASDPLNNFRVTVTIEPEVAGDVVLYGNYRSTSGNLIVSLPRLIATRRPPRATLQRIELRPSRARVETGAVIRPEIWGVFSDDSRQELFVGLFQARFKSSNTNAVATDLGQELRALAPGEALVDVQLNGFLAQCQITVDQPLPPRLSSRLSPGRLGVELSLFGEPGRIWTVESSSDLKEWNPYLNITNLNGLEIFSDSNNTTNKFYRAFDASE